MHSAAAAVSQDNNAPSDLRGMVVPSRSCVVSGRLNKSLPRVSSLATSLGSCSQAHGCAADGTEHTTTQSASGALRWAPDSHTHTPSVAANEATSGARHPRASVPAPAPAPAAPAPAPAPGAPGPTEGAPDPARTPSTPDMGPRDASMVCNLTTRSTSVRCTHAEMVTIGVFSHTCPMYLHYH